MGDRYVEVTPITGPYEGPAAVMPFSRTPDGDMDNALLLRVEDAMKVEELVRAGNGCVRVKLMPGGVYRFSLAASVQ